jgi:rRNA-processing protein FCF1
MAFAPARRETLKVILDSNALFVPLQFKIDVFNDLKRLLNRSFDFAFSSQTGTRGARREKLT